jgi:hypothetical protein
MKMESLAEKLVLDWRIANLTSRIELKRTELERELVVDPI